MNEMQDMILRLHDYFKALQSGDSPLLRHPEFMHFLRDLETYVQLPGAETRMDFYPCLEERLTETKIDRHYFYQDTWAAETIFKIMPNCLVDVGSTALLVEILSRRFRTISIDIRPLPVSLDNLDCRRGSITDLPFEDGTVECLSSLCVIEHVGLGRYGDPVDPLGSFKAFQEVRRVTAPGGHLMISLPLSHTSGVLFNAHRIFTRMESLSQLPDFTVAGECFLFPEPRGEKCIESLRGFQYCVWCSHLVKRHHGRNSP
jgi:SAM-dependent methyltransferase